MDRYARSTRARGQTYDNERYGASTRGRDQSYNNNNNGHDSHAGDDSSSDDEFRSTRDDFPSGPPPFNRHRERRRRPQPMHLDSEHDEAPRHGMRTTRRDERRPGDSDDAYGARVRDRDECEVPGGRYDTRVRENMRSSTSRRPTRRETIRGDDISDSESDLEPQPRRRPGMATSSGLGREGGRGVDLGSRYGSRGPCDHVRGPRRTGDRIDYDDDSEADPVFDVGYRERRRF